MNAERPVLNQETITKIREQRQKRGLVVHPIAPTEPQLLKERDIKKIKSGVSRIMEGVPASHGWEHAQAVEEYGTYLSLSQGIRPELIKLAALLHDLRWEEGEERQARGLPVEIKKGSKRDTRTKGATKRTLVGLYTEGKLEATQIGNITRATVRHGRLPEDIRHPSPIINVLMDADRLSRQGIEGLISIVESNRSSVPFCQNRAKIKQLTWPTNTPLFPHEKIKSCIDDLQDCDSWWNLINEPHAYSLFQTSRQVNRKFAEVFATHVEKQRAKKKGSIKDYDVWLGWLKGIEEKTKPQREKARELLAKGDHEAYRENLITAERKAREELTIENFETYLKLT